MLLLQLEGILDAGEFGREGLIDLQPLLDGIATMNDRRVIAVANQLTYTPRWHLRVLLGKVHRHLANLHIVTLAALAEHVLLGDVIMLADLLNDIVDGQRMVVNLHGTLDDALCQPHIHARIIYD